MPFFFRKTTQLTIIGDTHMRHEELGALSGEVLIHVGDVFDIFQQDEDDLRRVDEWFGRQRFDLILCIAGNHDLPVEACRTRSQQPFRNAIYLEDATFEYKGIRFFGTPWVPDLPKHAFHAPQSVLPQKWAAIPPDTDVLITHTPPAGILDQSSRGRSFGCPWLTAAAARVAPRVHCFGHVHASGGKRRLGRTTYINASCTDRPGGPLRAPVRIRV